MSRLLGPASGEGKAFFGDFASFHQGRLYQATGNGERARELFNRVQNTYPESDLKDDVAYRLARLSDAPAAKAAVAPTPEAAAAEPTPEAPVAEKPDAGKPQVEAPTPAPAEGGE